MSTLVEVRPIHIKKWHEKTEKESFTQKKTIRAFIDPDTRKYATGLTEEDKQYLIEKMGFKGDLDDSDLGEPHPTWDSSDMRVQLHNRTMFFNKAVPSDFIKIAIMKASPFVANSMEDYENGLYPQATHVIFDESQHIEAKASKIELRNKCIIEAAKLSKERKLNLIVALGGKNLKNQSDNYIVEALDKFIFEDAERVYRFMKREPKELADFALVLNCLQRNILRKDGHKIMYLDEIIGHDVEDVVDYISKDENQPFKLILIEKVNR